MTNGLLFLKPNTLLFLCCSNIPDALLIFSLLIAISLSGAVFHVCIAAGELGALLQAELLGLETEEGRQNGAHVPWCNSKRTKADSMVD